MKSLLSIGMLTQDVLEIITVFSARLSGLRSHQNKAVIDELDKSAKKISETFGINSEIAVELNNA